MKALTLIQPWAYAIAHLSKRVENRTWAPPAAVLGQRIAIHAGKKADVDAVDLANAGHDLGRGGGIVFGAIVCTAVVTGIATRFYPKRQRGAFAMPHVEISPGDGRPMWQPPSDDFFAKCFDPWFTGPLGWVLDEVVVLTSPVPCRGAQGLWTVPADVATDVRERHR